MVGGLFVVAALFLACIFRRQNWQFVAVLVSLCLIVGSLFESLNQSAHWGWGLVFIFATAVLATTVVSLTGRKG